LGQKKAVSILVAIALCAAAVAAFMWLPKRYTVNRSMGQTVVFWNDQDAFLVLNLNEMGRSRNFLQEKLAGTRYGYLTLVAGGFADFNKQDVIAYHLASSGQLDRFPLPDKTATFGTWGLTDGKLQLTPLYSTTGLTGFRWDGEKFLTVPAPPKPRPQAEPQSAADSRLTSDDLADDETSDEEEYDGSLSKSSRRVFKQAGWHYKILTGYESKLTVAILPIALGRNTFSLTIMTTPLDKAGATHFDFPSFGAKSIQLSGDKLASSPLTLWNQNGWQPIPKADYEQLQARFGHSTAFRRRSTTSLVWLAILLMLLVWRFGGWLHVLFTFATMKRRVLNNMATTYSFPPATPAQFPLLDLDALAGYTRDFEGMGFTRLLDFSLVSDSKVSPPCFCRLFVHTRHHVFAEVSQIFPKGKAPMPLRCSVQAPLQNFWSITFSDRKPQASSSLIRRRNALGIWMPEASPSDLLQALLKMRDQVCMDLGVQPLNDNTLEAYIARMQRSATDMREAVQQKNFIKGIPEVYLRKFSLMKTKPEYVWLGDYPKEAEQRKTGFSSFAATVR
jgi:hypothetical protein